MHYFSNMPTLGMCTGYPIYDEKAAVVAVLTMHTLIKVGVSMS